MDRAILLKEAICDGLRQRHQLNMARIIEALQFDLDPLRGRVVVYLHPNQQASDDVVSCLRCAIEDGLRENGYFDPVWIEAPYKGQIPKGSELSLVV